MVVSQCLLLQEEVYIINQRGREPHILRGGRSRPRRFLFNASEPAAEFRARWNLAAAGRNLPQVCGRELVPTGRRTCEKQKLF